MLKIFLMILITVSLLAMNQYPEDMQEQEKSIEIIRVNHDLCIIGKPVYEGIHAYLIIRQQFIEIVLVKSDRKTRLINTLEIINLKNNFIEKLIANNQVKSLIATFFSSDEDFSLALENTLPRVAMWDMDKKF